MVAPNGGDRTPGGIVDASASGDQFAVETGIEGTVTDTDGTALEGVTVTLDTGDETVTDSSGVYTFSVSEGSYTVSTDPIGYQAQSHKVDVVSGAVTVQDFTLDAELGLAVLDGQSAKVEGGGTVEVLLDAYHVEQFEVQLTGTYDESDANLAIGGTDAQFDTTYSLGGYTGEISVTVETTSGTSGEFGLDHVATGYGDQQTVSTGPTTVYEELLRVGVVDANDNYGATVVDVLGTELSPDHEVQTTTAADVIADPTYYDAVVAQLLPDSDVTDFVGQTQTSDVGVVYLDQWGDEANAVPQFAGESADVNGTSQNDSYFGDSVAPISYEATDQHPILEIGVGESKVLHDSQYADITWFDLASDSGFNVIADAIDDAGAGGSGLAVDDATRTVLASTLGYSQYVGKPQFTTFADTTLANCVRYATDAGLSVSAVGDSISVDGQATISISGQNLDRITVTAIWTDWALVSIVSDGANKVTNEISQAGKLTFDWDSIQLSTSVSFDVDLPARYVGGRYLLHVTVTDGVDAVEETAVLEVT
jgi:hypothetical protein